MWLIVLVSLLFSALKALPVEKTYTKQSHMDDHASSGSAYSYQIHSGVPATYAAFSENIQTYPPLTYPPVARHTYPPIHFPAAKYGQPLYIPFKELEYATVSPEKFIKESGAEYGAAHTASHGEKGDSGYKSLEEYAKGAKGKHGNEEHKGYYQQKGGGHKGFYDAAGHYGNHDNSGKSYKGGSFSEDKGKKKGSTTKGYHRVHHKDEYQKSHKFYDESDAHGHFTKYGDYDAKKAAIEGNFKKGGHVDSAYDKGDYGKQGFTDKGSYVDENSGYKDKLGKEQYYKDHEKYGKKSGQQVNHEHEIVE